MRKNPPMQVNGARGTRFTFTHDLWMKDTPVVVSEDIVPEEELLRAYTLRRLRQTIDKWVEAGKVKIFDADMPSGYYGIPGVLFVVGEEKFHYIKQEDLTEELVARIGFAITFAEKNTPYDAESRTFEK